MKIPLSKRLLRCCDYIANGDTVADIGCDHGYLGIHLLTSGKAKRVIAADINRMPLQTAVENAKKYGVEENISFHLSDGAVSIPRDFNTMVCAGMGADTMVSILENAPWLKNSRYRLILQCQSKSAMLRSYLSQNGWQIQKESALKDGRFLYTVMEVHFGCGKTLTPGQCYFSPALARENTQEANAYLQQVLARLERSIRGQSDCADPTLVAAYNELKGKVY